MKYFLGYIAFVIIISALALTGNEIFYFFASLYQYGIYIFIAVVAVAAVAYNFLSNGKE